MSRSDQKYIGLTRNIKNPNDYVKALYGSYKDWTLDEREALQYKGKWLSLFPGKTVLDLEIGPGAGQCFSGLCLKNPDRAFLAVEIKYKPLIQTIRRVRSNGSENARVIRYNASWIKNLFVDGELNSVYIHFPDPWLKKRKSQKHQLIQMDFCRQLHCIQKTGSSLEFKTDSLDYFEQSVENFKTAGYRLKKYSKDFYLNVKQPNLKNLSQFELIFFKKNIPIKYALFFKA